MSALNQTAVALSILSSAVVLLMLIGARKLAEASENRRPAGVLREMILDPVRFEWALFVASGLLMCAVVTAAITSLQSGAEPILVAGGGLLAALFARIFVRPPVDPENTLASVLSAAVPPVGFAIVGFGLAAAYVSGAGTAFQI